MFFLNNLMILYKRDDNLDKSYYYNIYDTSFVNFFLVWTFVGPMCLKHFKTYDWMAEQE